MIIDFSKRGGGKTTRMLLWLCAKEDRILITHLGIEKEMLKETLLNPPFCITKGCRDELFEISKRIFTYEEYKKYYNPKIREIGIDNADFFLQSLFLHPIAKITMTEE